MNTALHLNLRVDPTQYIPQIRRVPGYDYIHLVREAQYMTDISLLNDKVFYLKDILNPREYVQQHNISLLHAHHGQLGILLLPIKHQTTLPLVTSIRGRDATLSQQHFSYLENMQMLFRQSERFFPVCQYLAEKIVDMGCPPDKIRVLYGGVDLNKFKFRLPLGNSENILSIGRLVEKKGHHILMEAFQRIRPKFPNATLTIIGSGQLENYLISLASQLNLGDSFRLIKHIPKEEVYKHMANSDVFCAASLESTDGDVEGIPNTLKEAMATGLPIISTLHAGIPELITNNKEGILVKENHVEDLANALDTMLTHKRYWKKFARAARQKVKKDFNLKKQLVQQANLYDELLGR